MESDSQSFEAVWKLICECEGQIFYTIRGLPFIYQINGNSLIPDRTQYPLSKKNFLRAFLMQPLKGPGEINTKVRGPAYVWAILNDARIKKKDKVLLNDVKLNLKI